MSHSQGNMNIRTNQFFTYLEITKLDSSVVSCTYETIFLSSAYYNCISDDVNDLCKNKATSV